MTLRDLISSDPTPAAPPPPSSSPAALPPPSSGTGKPATTDRKSKRGTLLQIQSDTISAAKAALNPVRTNILPQKHKQRKKVNEFLAGAGTDTPDVEEYIISRPSMSYDDMWAKTLLETSELEEDDARSLGTSSPDSIGSVETSISSHFGGMNYPSLFSSKPAYGSSQSTEKPAASRFSNPSSGSSSMYEDRGSPFREDPPPYTSPVRRFKSFENPLAGTGSCSFESFQDEEQASLGNPQFGSALYDFTAGGDELNLVAGQEVEIEYEVDG